MQILKNEMSRLKGQARETRRTSFRGRQEAERVYAELLARIDKQTNGKNSSAVTSMAQHKSHINGDIHSPTANLDISLRDATKEGAFIGSLVGAVIASIAVMILFGRGGGVAPANILGFVVNGLIALAVVGATVGGLLGGIAGAVVGAKICALTKENHENQIKGNEK